MNKCGTCKFFDGVNKCKLHKFEVNYRTDACEFFF